MEAEEFYNSVKVNSSTEELMIAFAKYHVALALEAAVKNADVYSIDEAGQKNYYTNARVDRESILTSYSLENIK